MGRRLTDEERADRKMSEKKLNDRIVYRLKKHGLPFLRMQRATIGGAWRTPGTKGFPDLVIFGDTVLYRELKRELGKLDPDQERWREIIIAAGGDWGIWRPSDIRTGIAEWEMKRIALSLTVYPPLDNNDPARDNLARSGAR